MKKNILIGIVAFGGLLLITSVLPNTKNTEELNRAETGTSDIPSLSGDLLVFPIYPEANIKNVNDTDGTTARDVSVSLGAHDSKNDIYDWYRDALSSNGWSIKSDKVVAGYRIIQSENNNLYTSLQVGSGAEGDELIISQHLKIRK